MEYPTYIPNRIMAQSRSLPVSAQGTTDHDMAPSMNYPMNTDGTADGGVANFALPPFSMFQSATDGSLPSFVNSNPVSTTSTRTVSNLVDVDNIIRLRQLSNSVFLVSRGTQGNDAFVQLGVVVNDPPAVPQAAPAELSQARGDHLPFNTHRLVHSLRKQVRELQRQMSDVESEFQVRYHREQALNNKLKGLVDRYAAAAKFKCDQATQVDFQSPSTARREQAVQTSGFPSDVRPSGSGQLSNHSRRNVLESSITEPPRNSISRMHTSTPLSVVADETEGPFPATVTERDVRCSTGSSDSSSSDSDDRRILHAQSRGRGKFSRKRKRSRNTTPGIRSITSGDSEGYSGFPPSHPFRRSRHIALPPQVPDSYCSACYEKMRSRVPGKFCFTCKKSMSCLRDAYLANSNIQLPECNHPMGDPKRHCKGCSFKVYTYRYNLRFPTNPLPFPVTY